MYFLKVLNDSPGYSKMQKFSHFSMLSILKSSFLVVLLTFSPLNADARPVIFNIDASRDDGTQIGNFIGAEVKKNFPDVEQQYDHYLDFLFSPRQFKQLIPQIKVLKSVVEPIYQDEVNAIAASWQLTAPDKLGDGKLSLNEFWLLQLLPDLTALNKGTAFAVTNRSDNNPIVGRNVDWKSTEDLKNLQTISLYHYENRTVVNIGFAGWVGVISGFNEQGLFVSVLDASELQTANARAPQQASGFELRNILKNQNTLVAASEVLAEGRYARNLQFVLADQKNVAVLEQPLGKIGKLRKTDSLISPKMNWNHSDYLATVGCFVLKSSPQNCYSSNDYYRWGRLKQLLRGFAEQDLSVNNVIALMLDQANIHQAIFNENTLQTLVFTPKDQTLYLYTQPTLKTKRAQPLVEKYQFIKTIEHSKTSLVDILLLLLGVGILIAAWFYIFRDTLPKKRRLSRHISPFKDLIP
jgi:Acyl-coenzyme A:6-aminopenicillanic acid acyl-transferase